jgi:hypothetical protein
MVQIYNEITIYFYKAIFPSGASPSNPHMEECTFFWVVKSSWGINTAKIKDL